MRTLVVLALAGLMMATSLTMSRALADPVPPAFCSTCHGQ